VVRGGGLALTAPAPANNGGSDGARRTAERPPRHQRADPCGQSSSRARWLWRSNAASESVSTRGQATAPSTRGTREARGSTPPPPNQNKKPAKRHSLVPSMAGAERSTVSVCLRAGVAPVAMAEVTASMECGWALGWGKRGLNGRGANAARRRG